MNKMRVFIWLAAALFLVGTVACENDDTEDFSEYINNPDDNDNDGNDDEDNNNEEIPVVVAGCDTLYIEYKGATAEVTGDDKGYVTISGADVIINALEADTTMLVVLSGSTDDGSLLVYRQKTFTIQLNGVSITNTDGPAINNQCSKALYVETMEGTENTLTDGIAYAEAPVMDNGESIDQKGTLFSEGEIYFYGSGILTVNGKGKNGIASDDFIFFQNGTVNVNVANTGTNGVKVNDGITIQGGQLNITVAADGARGIKSDAYTTITGGKTTINTSGACRIETSTDGIRDTTSCAGIKCDSLFTMQAGTLTITSSGDGGKGINSAQNVEFSGGTLSVTTTGNNKVGKPKGVKSDTGIILSGGSFTVKVKKSWACDNGSDTDDIKDMLTINGTPTTKSLDKKSVTVIYN